MNAPENIRATRREVLDRVKTLMGWDEHKALLWLTTPNPHFGNVAPSTMIVMGRGHKVLKFIAGAEEENAKV
jgi:hypothetical protein